MGKVVTGGEEVTDSRWGPGGGIGGLSDKIKVDPIGRTIWPASLRPPPVSLPGGEDPSSYILLDVMSYIADRGDVPTTAKSSTRGGHEILATLCIARPPRVSYLCVHCPALTPSNFGTEPLILATSNDLILFKVAICRSYYCNEQGVQDFYIYHYRAGTRSSLKRIPHPGRSSCHFGVSSFGLLRLKDSQTAGHVLPPRDSAQPEYIVAVLCNCNCKLGKPQLEYHLHRFRSGDSRWTTTVLPFTPTKPSPGLTFFCHITHKAITLGGGYMGWVDLCRGILLCNVLLDEPKLFFIPLPQLLQPGGELPCDARSVRDVDVVNGHIKYVEYLTDIKEFTDDGSYVSENWKIATCSCKIHRESWEVGLSTDGSYVSDNWKIATSRRLRRKRSSQPGVGLWQDRLETYGSSIVGSVSDLLRYKTSTPLPHLQRLHTGLPTLSFDPDDVMFVLAKVEHRDENAFILRVNMRNGTLEGDDWFEAERTVGISFSHTQMAISHYPTPVLSAPVGTKFTRNLPPHQGVRTYVRPSGDIIPVFNLYYICSTYPRCHTGLQPLLLVLGRIPASCLYIVECS